MQYEVLSLISVDTASGHLPGTVLDETDLTPQQIAGYLAAGAIAETRRKPTPEPVAKIPTAAPMGVLGVEEVEVEKPKAAAKKKK